MAPALAARIDRCAAGLSPEQARAFRRLARELQAHQGRWGLFFLRFEHADDQRKVGEAIAGLVDRPRQVLLHAVQKSVGEWPEVEALLSAEAPHADLIQVQGLEEWLYAAAGLGPEAQHEVALKRLRAWNVRREAFAVEVPVPVLFWLRRPTLRHIASAAPDLWAWRTGVHDFSVARPTIVAETTDSIRRFPQIDGIDNRTVEQRIQRIQELRDYFSTPEAQVADAALRMALFDELAMLLAFIGHIDEALRLLREEVLPACERLGEVRSKAVTQGQIADILQLRGQLDEALRLLREEVLPACERLGDVRLKAVTQGKIADILQSRGQLDEALRIRLEEQLPVYEMLGDMRSKAVTQGRIADILQLRGQLDEALRIRLEEELPVYERLGNAREKAVTHGKIANILQSRGQLDEALRIRLEEELPVYERLGDVRLKAVAQGQIANILQLRGQLEEALALHLDRFETFERLHDADGMAHTLFSLAQIRLKRSDQASGGIQLIYEDLVQAFAINQQLQRPNGIAVVGTLLAQVLARQGMRDEALKVLDAAEGGFRTLGDTNGIAQIHQLRQQIRPASD